jgi:antitoxin (DNA-binding transcriptional repressor) of toxin-antitoxin stability system
MNTITATELRTKTPELIEALMNGYSVDFIHRSTLVGEIIPAKKPAKIMSGKDIEELMEMAGSLNLPKLTDKEIDRRYRQHIMKKYGKGLS